MTASKRIVHLDVFRFLMVSVALLSHVLGYFYTWGALSEPLRNYLKLFTRGATTCYYRLVRLATHARY